MKIWTSLLAGALMLLALASPARAKPTGPGLFCESYPTSPLCTGRQPDCTLCHTSPPAHNLLGAAIAASLLPGEPRPLSDARFAAAMPAALAALEAADTDKDGTSNLDEIAQGTLPGDAASKPNAQGCAGEVSNPYYNVCGYDPRYALKKIYLDVCGHSPSYEEMEEFSALAREAQMQRLDEVLDTCLDSEFWLGKNGALWQLAHDKVRPLGSIKAGEDPGQVQFSDYYDDYQLFVYTHTDNRDVREMLTADYFVSRVSDAPTRYERVNTRPTQFVQPERRAGMLTTSWVMAYQVMFSALPRTAAAQAYRAFLGLDIARLEGLYPIPGEPYDYDNKQVAQAECAVCHSTLDPLSYPFKNYNGFQSPWFSYREDRIEAFYLDEGPNIAQMPESGYLFGQPVADLIEWAQVAANSTQFLIATVSDYWKLMTGEEPTPDNQEFRRVWQRLGNENAYSVERMLHDLIKTEAYGVP